MPNAPPRKVLWVLSCSHGSISIAQQWNTVRFGAVSVETHDNLHVFRVQVLPGDLPLDDFRVELYANPLREGESAVQAMTAIEKAALKKES